MEPALVETLEAATEALVRRHVTEGSLILDAGCGPGTLLARLYAAGYEMTGYDLSLDYLQYIAEVLDTDQVTIALGDLEESAPLNWLERFDAVVCADVLEHVLDEHQVLRELSRVLKPGGHLIIRVPVEPDLSIYLGGGYEYVHLRQFTHASLQLLLEKIHGLTVIDADTIDYPGWTEIHAVAVKP